LVVVVVVVEMGEPQTKLQNRNELIGVEWSGKRVSEEE
jgi:hypothetical protein